MKLNISVDGHPASPESIDPSDVIDLLQFLIQSCKKNKMEITCDALQDAIETFEEETHTVAAGTIFSPAISTGIRLH